MPLLKPVSSFTVHANTAELCKAETKTIRDRPAQAATVSFLLQAVACSHRPAAKGFPDGIALTWCT